MIDDPSEEDDFGTDDGVGMVKSMALGQAARMWIEKNLTYVEYPDLYEFPHSSYSDYSGGFVERSNSAFLTNKFPNLVTTETGGAGTVWTGIKPDKLLALTDEQREEIEAVLKDLHDYPCLDDDLMSTLEHEAFKEAYDDYYRRDFYKELQKQISARFSGMDEEQRLLDFVENVYDNHQEDFDKFFWDVYSASEEYYETEEGGNVNINLERVVAKGKAVQKLGELEAPRDMNQNTFPFYDDMVESLVEKLTESIVPARLLREGYDYSCVMADAPDEVAKIVRTWGEMNISDDVLFIDEKDSTKGRETESHVTVKYGLVDSNPSEELLRIIQETPPFEITLGKVSLFKNDKFDVVKIGVDGKGLRALNARISKLPNEDKHPNYTPHMTIAYVQKGSCDDLEGKEVFTDDVSHRDDDEPLTFTVKSVVFAGSGEEDETRVKRTLMLGKPNAMANSSDSDEGE